MLVLLLAAICILELIVIIVLSASLVIQCVTKHEELDTVVAEMKTKADDYYENTSGSAQRAAAILYGFVDRLRGL